MCMYIYIYIYLDTLHGCLEQHELDDKACAAGIPT